MSKDSREPGGKKLPEEMAPEIQEGRGPPKEAHRYTWSLWLDLSWGNPNEGDQVNQE